MKEETRRKLEERLSELRQSEAIRFLAVADDVGLFDTAVTRAQLRAGLAELRRTLPSKPSRSAQVARRLQDADKAPRPRKDESRARILLGKFLLAQTARMPSLRIRLVPELAAFLSRGRSRASANNWKVLMPVYQAWGAGEAAPEGTLRHRAETRGQIVLGAYAQNVLDEDRELRKLLLPELDSFLAGLDTRTDAGNRRVLAPWIAKWSSVDSETDAPDS